jgi:hypothetical protein
LNSNTPTKILRKRLPSPAERLSNPDALLSRTDLRELGLEAADAVKLERILREVAEREEAGGEYGRCDEWRRRAFPARESGRGLRLPEHDGRHRPAAGAAREGTPAVETRRILCGGLK